MKNKDILELWNGINLCGELKGVKFSFAIAKNINKLKTESETILTATKELQEKYAKKDKEGKILSKDNQVIFKDREAFDKDYQELMSIENKIELHKIKESDVPEDISVNQLSSIMALIK